MTLRAEVELIAAAGMVLEALRDVTVVVSMLVVAIAGEWNS